LAAVDYFLKLDGIQGESQDAAHPGWIEINSFSWGATNPSSTAGSGTGAGKVSVNDFQIVKRLDSSSPSLLLDAAAGKYIASGTLEGVRADGQVYLDYKLTGLRVTGVQVNGGASESVPTEQVSFNFTNVEYDYTPYSPSGRPDPVVTSAWTLGTNGVSSGGVSASTQQQSLVADASQQTVVAYLKLGGVQGESQDSAHSGWIDVFSFSWGESQPRATSGGGGGAGKVSFSDFQIVKKLDMSSPVLALDAAGQKWIPSGVLELVRPGGQVYMDYNLTGVSLTGVQASAGASDPLPWETMEMKYAGIAWNYTPYGPDGTPGTAVSAAWTLGTNGVSSASGASASTQQQNLLTNASSQAVVAYLKLDGVQGESQDAAHAGWIDVLSWSWGATNSSSLGGGGGAGKVSFNDFQIVKHLDSSSPLLALGASDGQYITSAILELIGADGLPIMDYDLTGVRLTGVQAGSGASNPLPLEEVGLKYSTIKWDYTSYSVSATGGTVPTTVSASWTLGTNGVSSGGGGALTPYLEGNPDQPLDASSQTVVAYLKLDGLQGESQDAAHSGWIDVLSWSWGATNSSSAGGGGGAGKVSFSDFQIVKRLDSSSPSLALDAADGQYIAGGVLQLVRPDGQVLMEYNLTGLLVTGVQAAAGASNPQPLEDIFIKYGGISWNYTPYSPAGQPGTPVSAAWTLGTNGVSSASGGTLTSAQQQALLADTSSQAVVAYLELSGVQGESQDAAHTAWIDVLSFSWGVGRGISASGGGGGGGAGKASFNDFRIVKELDQSSPQLVIDAADGKYIPSGVLELVRPDGQVFMDYKLTGLRVTGVQSLAGSGDPRPMEQVSLRFSKIECDYTPYSPGGQPSPVVTSAWTLGTNGVSSAGGALAPADQQALLAAASPQTVAAYIELAGVQGESHDPAHTGWIDVLSFSWGASHSSSTGAGSGAGKVSFNDLRIVKEIDKSSPQSFLNAAEGKYILSGVLELVRPDGQVFMDYKLTNVIVSAVQILGGTSSSDRPMEQVTLNFTKIEYDYTPYSASGTPGTTVIAGWDLSANQAFTASPTGGLVQPAAPSQLPMANQAFWASTARVLVGPPVPPWLLTAMQMSPEGTVAAAAVKANNVPLSAPRQASPAAAADFWDPAPNLRDRGPLFTDPAINWLTFAPRSA